MSTGLILKGIGGFYTVQTDAGPVVCRPRGRFRRDGIRPLPGDRVTLSLGSDGAGRLDEIHPRKNVWDRPPVANIDLLVIVASLSEPKSGFFFLDRMTVQAEMKRTDVLIAINKTDLDPADALFDTYRLAGFPCLRLCAKSGEGVEALRAQLRGKTVAFAGHSGVGKSSLLNALDPNMALPVGEVSAKTGRGRHTTRHVELMRVVPDILVADTPGFSAFDFDLEADCAPEDVWTHFRESRTVTEACRFLDCRHNGVEGCAVEEAVRRGAVARTRYESYRKLFETAKERDRYS